MPEEVKIIPFTPTNKIRFLLRRNGLSMNPSYFNVLQQWWSDGTVGKWIDVQQEVEE